VQSTVGIDEKQFGSVAPPHRFGAAVRRDGDALRAGDRPDRYFRSPLVRSRSHMTSSSIFRPAAEPARIGSLRPTAIR
jgi:hypothetical protein